MSVQKVVVMQRTGFSNTGESLSYYILNLKGPCTYIDGDVSQRCSSGPRCVGLQSPKRRGTVRCVETEGELWLPRQNLTKNPTDNENEGVEFDVHSRFVQMGAMATG